MTDGDTRIAHIRLPDGTPVWARISGAEQLIPQPRPAPGEYADSGYGEGGPGDGGYADSGFLSDRVVARLESLDGLVAGVTRSVADALRGVRPDEVSVQFGIELSGRSGHLVGLLADGGTKASINVTLTWQGGPPRDAGEPRRDGEPRQEDDGA